MSTGVFVRMQPAKVIAGLEPEETNAFLQLFAKAVLKKVCVRECDKKYEKINCSATSCEMWFGTWRWACKRFAGVALQCFVDGYLLYNSCRVLLGAMLNIRFAEL